MHGGGGRGRDDVGVVMRGGVNTGAKSAVCGENRGENCGENCVDIWEQDLGASGGETNVGKFHRKTHI